MRGCFFPSISDFPGFLQARAPRRPAWGISSAPAIGLAGALLLLGCAGPGPIPAPTAKNVELAQRHGEVTTLPTLKLGRKLYISRCSACHGLKAPGFLTPSEWPEMVERMAPDAKVNADQQRAITQYLVSVSAATHDSTAIVPAGAPPAAN
jgi:mono/diheme cytochrome c family protein